MLSFGVRGLAVGSVPTEVRYVGSTELYFGSFSCLIDDLDRWRTSAMSAWAS